MSARRWITCFAVLLLHAYPKEAAADMPRARGYENHLYIAVTPTNDAQLRALWSGRAIVVEPHDPALVPHKLAVTQAELRALQHQGVSHTVLNPSFQAVLDAAYESWMHAPSRGYSGPVPDWFARVQSLTAIFDYMDELAKQSQGRASVKMLGRAFEQDMRAIRISSAPEDGQRATILVTGTQHADEWLSPMVVTGLIWGLITNYETDPDVKKVVDNLNVYVIPVMNPDSYAQGNLARRTNQNPRCTGGVNLNRNWPSVGWGRGVQPCGGDNFAGEEALSEPETKAAKALADALSHLVWYVDYHTPREAVMIPYAWTSMKPKMYDEAKKAAQSYASILGVRAQDGTIIGQGQGGGSLDYFQEALDTSGGISLCIEMTGSVDMRAPSSGIPEQVDKNLRAWLSVAATLADAHPNPIGAAGAAGMSGGVGGTPAASSGGAGASGGMAAAGGGAVAQSGSSGMAAAGHAAGAPSTGAAMAAAGSGGSTPAIPVSAGSAATTPRNTNMTSSQPVMASAASAIASAGTGASPTSPAEMKSSGCGVVAPAARSGWLHLLSVAALWGWCSRRTRPTRKDKTDCP